jgi:hypothetical protein
LPLTKALAASSSPSPSLLPKLTGDQAARPRPNPQGSRHRSKCRPLLPRALKRDADMVVRLAHPQLPPSRQLPSSHERLRALKCSFFSGKKEHTACCAISKVPDLSSSASPSAPCFQEFFVRFRIFSRAVASGRIKTSLRKARSSCSLVVTEVSTFELRSRMSKGNT